MSDGHRPAALLNRQVAWRYAVHVVLCLAVAGAVWHHHLPWLSSDPQDVQRYLPLGFAMQTGLLLGLATRLRPDRLSMILGLDLLGWGGLAGAIVATHISPVWYGGWLTGAISIKLVSLLWVLLQRVRLGLADCLAAAAASATFLVTSLLMLPYTRFGVPNSVGITGDEPHFLTVTANLLAGGGFWVGKAYSNGISARVYGAPLPFSQAHVVRTATGHYGPLHDLGVSLLAAPFYALGGTKAVMIAWAVIAAVTVYEIYLAVRAARVAARASMVATVLAALSLPFLPEATQVSPEIPLACCAALIARRLLSQSESRLDVLVTSVALAAMPWLQVRGWLIVVPLLIAALLIWTSWFARIALIGIVAVSTVAYWSLLYAIYGWFIISPLYLAPGLHIDLSHVGLTAIVGALESVLLDPVSGLLPNGPIWLLALVGLVVLARKSVAGAAITVAIVVYLVCVGVSTLTGTSQGYGPPGRFSVVLVPLLAAPLGLAWEQVTGRWWSEIRWLLVAWTVVCAFTVQAVRVLTYGSGLTAALARLAGIRVPTLDEGSTPWMLLGGLVVMTALIVFAAHGLPATRQEVATGT